MNLLVVEDEPAVAEFLSRALGREGYNVTAVHTGKEALTKAYEPDIDLILLDVLLPDFEGTQVCRKLRADGIRTPVLMLTARDALEDKVGGLRLGADDYLTKPFDFDELLARIEALIRRAHAPPLQRSTLQVRDLSFDLQTLQVTRAGREIRLTDKEMSLLELLMRRPGKVFSRAEILDHVWGDDKDPLTNIVDVYIRHLRSKIDEGEQVQLIGTVRNRGYRLLSDD